MDVLEENEFDPFLVQSHCPDLVLPAQVDSTSLYLHGPR